MKTYLKLMDDILKNGVERHDRTGTGTYSVFGRQLKFDLRKGLPIVTTKKIHLKSVIHELLWMISGDTNVQYLNDNGVTIWNEWCDENGDLGKIYGHQWRNWNSTGLDQLKAIIHQIKTDPNSRRHIVMAWNPEELQSMALPPCHMMFQFYVADGELSLSMYQRSADVFLGLPFNILSYSLILSMIAQVCGLNVGELTISIGDAHIYLNHKDQCMEQLRRKPFKLPELKLNTEKTDIDHFTYEDFFIDGYTHHDALPGEVAV